MRKQNFKTPNKVIKYESFRTFSEATESVVFTFGRFNPPTTGHEKLIEKVKKIAGGDDYYIFPSHSQNNKKVKSKICNVCEEKNEVIKKI